MKYILMKHNEHGHEEMYIFPKTKRHDKFFETISHPGDILISAGFVGFNDCIADDFKFYCYGESISLGVRSRGGIDDKLLKQSMPVF